jgi:hypothetical protein
MESNLDNIEIYVDGSPNSTPLHDESLLADEEFDMFDNEAESEVQHDSEEDAESRKQDIRKELRKEAQLKTKEYMNILCSMYGPKLKPKKWATVQKPWWKSWVPFREAQGLPTHFPGLGLGFFGDTNNPPTDGYDVRLTHSFMQHISANGGNYKELDNGKQFIHYHLAAEFTKRLHVGIAPKIGSDPIIVALLKDASACHAQDERDRGVDLQANLDLRITYKQKRDLVTNAFCSMDDQINKMFPLTRIQMVATYTKSGATLKRGEEYRAATFGMQFAREVEPFGYKLNHSLVNKGKANKVGRRTYAAYAPHTDPLLDAAAWDGLVLFQRFIIQDEPFVGRCCTFEGRT